MLDVLLVVIGTTHALVLFEKNDGKYISSTRNIIWRIVVSKSIQKPTGVCNIKYRNRKDLHAKHAKHAVRHSEV
jgi:hypothetical protein